ARGPKVDLGGDLKPPPAKTTPPEPAPADPPKKPLPEKKDPDKPEKPPEKPPAVEPTNQAVKQAIDRAVAHLRSLQQPDGSWKFTEMGATALAGLTLLECDVSAEDPAVARAAQFVRQGSVGCTHTYSLALGILFLDRLGEPEDVPLIESMGVRLLGGQTASGGGGFNPPEGGGGAKRGPDPPRCPRHPSGRRGPPAAPRPGEERP